MATTLRDIAAAAGTSVSTVSRVFSSHPGISTATAARVREKAKRLGYRVRNARRPQNGTPSLAQKTIALLALGIDRSLVSVPAVASTLHGAEAALGEAGAKVQLAHIPDMTVVPPSLDLPSLDGIILHGALQGNQLEVVSSRLLKRLRQVPAVWLLGRPRGGWGDAVGADDYRLGAMIAEYLVARGHRRVAFVNPKPDHLLFMRREDGLLGAARRLGLSVQCFCSAPPGGWEFPLQAPTHVEMVQHLVDQVLATRPRPTVIVAAVDSVAALIYRALAVRELRVGRDISVISGNADHRLIAPLHPQLTTLDIHPFEIGRRAVQQLALRLADPNPWPDGDWTVHPTLLEGESVVTIVAK